MLENWLEPIPKKIRQAVENQQFKFAYTIARHEGKMPDLKGVKAAIIGLEAEPANAIREALYQLSNPFGDALIADLGNARSNASNFLIPLIQELLSSNIVPILIGQNEALAHTQYRAQRMVQTALNYAVISERIPMDLDEENTKKQPWFHKMIDQKSDELFSTHFLGIQSHFTPTELFQNMQARGASITRLGSLRNNPAIAEPYLRDADLLAFNISALKQIEAPAHKNATPSGLTSEAACQLLRYAGMSEKLKSVGFYGFMPEKDRESHTAQVLAQMIWYFLDGLFSRKNDYPATVNRMMEYIVTMPSSSQTYTFWKSNKSGRWWLEVPFKVKKYMKRHQLIPCSYEDYKMAVNGEMPEQLMDAMERFS